MTNAAPAEAEMAPGEAVAASEALPPPPPPAPLPPLEPVDNVPDAADTDGLLKKPAHGCEARACVRKAAVSVRPGRGLQCKTL